MPYDPRRQQTREDWPAMVIGPGLDLRMLQTGFLRGSSALFREDPLAAVASRGHWFGRTDGSDSLSDSTHGCRGRTATARNVWSGSHHPHSARPTRRRIFGDLRDGRPDRYDQPLIAIDPEGVAAFTLPLSRLDPSHTPGREPQSESYSSQNSL